MLASAARRPLSGRRLRLPVGGVFAAVADPPGVNDRLVVQVPGSSLVPLIPNATNKGCALAGAPRRYGGAVTPDQAGSGRGRGHRQPTRCQRGKPTLANERRSNKDCRMRTHLAFWYRQRSSGRSTASEPAYASREVARHTIIPEIRNSRADAIQTIISHSPPPDRAPASSVTTAEPESA